MLRGQRGEEGGGSGARKSNTYVEYIYSALSNIKNYSSCHPVPDTDTTRKQTSRKSSALYTLAVPVIAIPTAIASTINRSISRIPIRVLNRRHI